MKKNYIPDWKLERYLLGELPADELEAVAALERDDEALRGRAAALRADNTEILAKYPPAFMAGKISRAADVHRTAHLWNRKNIYPWAVPALVCAAALLALPIQMAVTGAGSGGGLHDDGIRLKGMTPGIEVWRKEGESAEKLTPKTVARTGDIIQLRYLVPEFCYGALVSVDGRGVLTVHLSGDSGKAAPLPPGKPVALDNSYQLDDAPRFEAFYLITASKIFGIDEVTKSLEKAEHPLDGKRGLRLPQKHLTLTLRITSFTLLK